MNIFTFDITINMDIRFKTNSKPRYKLIRDKLIRADIIFACTGYNVLRKDVYIHLLITF